MTHVKTRLGEDEEFTCAYCEGRIEGQAVVADGEIVHAGACADARWKMLHEPPPETSAMQRIREHRKETGHSIETARDWRTGSIDFWCVECRRASKDGWSFGGSLDGYRGDMPYFIAHSDRKDHAVTLEDVARSWRDGDDVIMCTMYRDGWRKGNRLLTGDERSRALAANPDLPAAAFDTKANRAASDERLRKECFLCRKACGDDEPWGTCWWEGKVRGYHRSCAQDHNRRMAEASHERWVRAMVGPSNEDLEWQRRREIALEVGYWRSRAEADGKDPNHPDYWPGGLSG